MATGTKNEKSQKVQSRVPHEVIEEMEKVKDSGETTGSFIVLAIRGEIKRRQRKQAKDKAEE